MSVKFAPAPPWYHEALARVRDRHEWFKTLWQAEVTFEILLAYGASPALKHHGVPALAKIKILGPEDRAGGSPDVRISIDRDRFERRVEIAQEAVLAHELYHLVIAPVAADAEGKPIFERDEYKRPKIRTRPDDWCINGFKAIAAFYGEDSAEVRSYRAVGEILSQAVFGFAKAGERTEATDKAFVEAVTGAYMETVSPGYTISVEASNDSVPGNKMVDNPNLNAEANAILDAMDTTDVRRLCEFGMAESLRGPLRKAGLKTLDDLAAFLGAASPGFLAMSLLEKTGLSAEECADIVSAHHDFRAAQVTDHAAALPREHAPAADETIEPLTGADLELQERLRTKALAIVDEWREKAEKPKKRGRKPKPAQCEELPTPHTATAPKPKRERAAAKRKPRAAREERAL